MGSRMLDSADAEQGVYGEFYRARRKEFLGRLMRKLVARLRGIGASEGAGRLACFGEVSESSGALEECCRFFEAVEVERISGSVGRCMDFDRGFLPVCSCPRSGR